MASDINRKLKRSEDLIALYEELDDERKQSLCDFADFLYAKAEPVKKDIPAPEEIPRPETETVVGAVKRLKSTYPMIDSMAVFSQASALMTDHMVKGRDLIEVIDEMEVLFETEYNKLLELSGQINEQDSE
jgi:hypothetical protein